jgi:hypothetical protein
MVPDELYSLYHFSHPPLVERLRALNVQIKDINITSKTAATQEAKKSK